MTSFEIPKRIYMPCAFAGKNGATVASVSPAESSDNMNFPTGFPARYGCPESGNGKFVSRGEMNALGYIATQNEFSRACGGIVTFDPQLAEEIGGYPSGAVLDFLDGINYCKVVSIRDNNKVDFRSVGVDGVNWVRADMAGSVKDPLSLIDISDFDCRGFDGSTEAAVVNGANMSQCVGIFKSEWNGALYISGGADVEFGRVKKDGVDREWGGVALIAFKGHSLGEFSGKTAWSAGGTVIFGRGFSMAGGIDPSGAKVMEIMKSEVVQGQGEKPCYYAVFLGGFNCRLYNSTLSVRVSTNDNA